MTQKDTIYLNQQAVVDFVFDENVVSVFPDMINRSVPGYATIISMIGMLAERYAQENSVCFDLGCSLGASTLALRHHIKVNNCRIVAVDNSPAMINKCQDILASDSAEVPVELVCGDLLADVKIENASVVVLNFTLQFIEPTLRTELMEKIYQGLLPGGLLILSEKVRFEDEALDSLFIDMHHIFKQQQGYSKLEISRKRAAIENVLIPESLDEHEDRINKAGFKSFDVWFQCFNFASMVAVKS